jgi:hypothetical protein
METMDRHFELELEFTRGRHGRYAETSIELNNCRFRSQFLGGLRSEYDCDNCDSCSSERLRPMQLMETSGMTGQRIVVLRSILSVSANR